MCQLFLRKSSPLITQNSLLDFDLSFREVMLNEIEEDINQEDPFLEPDSTLENEGTAADVSCPAWDVFSAYEQEENDDSRESTAIRVGAKVLKVVAYIFTFTFILASSVISKSSLLLMTSTIAQNRSFQICKVGLELEKDKTYEVRISSEEYRGWVWCLLFSLLVPELLTFLRSMRICIFKSFRRPKLSTFLVVLLAESLHTTGLIILVFVVFPSMDVPKATALMYAVCLVPAIMKLVSKIGFEIKTYEDMKTCLTSTLLLDVLAAFFQFVGLVLWGSIKPESSVDRLRILCVPISAILVSCRWWENYTDEKTELLNSLKSLKQDLNKSRYMIYSFISVIKISLMISLTCACLIFNGQSEQSRNDVRKLFTDFSGGFRSQPITIYWLPSHEKDIPGRVKPEHQQIALSLKSDSSLPIYVFLIHITASFVCYQLSKFTCRIGIQRFSFSLPLSLSSPISSCMIMVFCGLRSKDPCVFRGVSPYIFWNCPEGDFVRNFFLSDHGWVWMLWVLSSMWIVFHIWIPKDERLASTQKLFVNPLYCTVVLDQSLVLNRRRDTNPKENEEFKEMLSDFYDKASDIVTDDISNLPKNIPRIYACATMWHETSDEMELLLKSIIRMDEDQSARKNAQFYLKVPDPDFYFLEVHIFFDDAFTYDDEGEEIVVNRFVKDFINVIDNAASKVHGTSIKLKPPVKIVTPYGGRLVWSLPGGNRLLVHLKNKDLIRHKKRWSQVMYMYYLLGHRLMELDIHLDEKIFMAENTFILALDGDIDFRPKAVQLLVDLMKKNKGLGAACGRIHPVGTGIMVYYQKFEYAIGHWLQKATEHMIGCVLCSPGCFSLIRAKALMDDNVMKSYTSQSVDAENYIQYDQGEDRWLCTLLLQRGYRIEYCAASDAYTHCPESFAEFYTQRRRWGPSTMANILDLLFHYKPTVACNDSISMLYIAYQAFMMVGTILGPGTIFLMLVGSVASAMGISNWNSFVYNFIPIAIFIVICFLAKNNTQIFVAQILSAGYALLMMAVLVGVSLQIAVDGVSSPSAIFLLSLAGSFLISAIMHPQEFSCLLHGILYFICVPSMYLLLTLYSMTNLHVVSWGTREVQAKKSKKQLEAEKKRKAADTAKNSSGKFSMIKGWDSSTDEEGNITFSFGNIFRCLCCTYPKTDESKMQMAGIEGKLEMICEQMGSLQKQMELTSNRMLGVRRKSVTRVTTEQLIPVSEDGETLEESEEMESACNLSDNEEEISIPNPTQSSITWLSDDMLKSGRIQNLSEKETMFWKALIKSYLYPLIDDPEEKKRIANRLKDLRNKAVFGFLMINSLFVLIVFLLQMQKDTLYVKWPFNVKANITYVKQLNLVDIESHHLKLEPINLVMVFFFMLILLIQFVGMLMHRTETMSHVLASTELNCCCSGTDRPSGDTDVNQNAVHIARRMQQLKDDETDSKYKVKPDPKIHRRQTIQILEHRQQAKPECKTLDDAFRTRYECLGSSPKTDVPMMNGLRKLSRSPEILEALKRRASAHFTNSCSTSLSSPKSHRLDLLRLDKAFGTPNGSVRSCFSNMGFDDDSWCSLRGTPTTVSPFQSRRVKLDNDLIGQSGFRSRLQKIGESSSSNNQQLLQQLQ